MRCRHRACRAPGRAPRAMPTPPSPPRATPYFAPRTAPGSFCQISTMPAAASRATTPTAPRRWSRRLRAAAAAHLEYDDRGPRPFLDEPSYRLPRLGAGDRVGVVREPHARGRRGDRVAGAFPSTIGFGTSRAWPPRALGSWRRAVSSSRPALLAPVPLDCAGAVSLPRSSTSCLYGFYFWVVSDDCSAGGKRATITEISVERVLEAKLTLEATRLRSRSRRPSRRSGRAEAGRDAASHRAPRICGTAAATLELAVFAPRRRSMRALEKR